MCLCNGCEYTSPVLIFRDYSRVVTNENVFGHSRWCSLTQILLELNFPAFQKQYWLTTDLNVRYNKITV